MKYLDWLKTNPEKGYYWVKYQDCAEERIDEFADWYDNAGNVETKFTEQPDEVISDRLTYIDYLDMVGHCGAYSEENAYLKELLKSALSWFPDSSKLRGGRYAQLQNLERKIKEVIK